MKLMLDEYEVEIRAKKTWHDKRNKKDTMEFLNTLSILLDSDINIFQEKAIDWSDEIYTKLKAEGAYNKQNA